MRRWAVLLGVVLVIAGAADAFAERGDVNLNGIPYEIGDVVLTASFFAHGVAVLDPVRAPEQIDAMDADCNGITPSIADVVRMIRVAIGSDEPCVESGAGRSAADISILDTLRILNVTANPGKTFPVDLYIRNVDSIGAYGIRVRYNPLLIEPVLYTQGTQQRILHELLRGTAMEIHVGATPEVGIATFAAFEFTWAPPYHTPGGGTSVRMQWRALPAALGQQTTIAFEADPEFPQSHNNMGNLSGSVAIYPTLVDGTVTVSSCYCPFQADINANGMVDAVDLALEIDCIFFCGGSMGPQDPNCPRGRMDFNADGPEDATDLAEMIDHVFFGGAGPVDPCSE